MNKKGKTAPELKSDIKLKIVSHTDPLAQKGYELRAEIYHRHIDYYDAEPDKWDKHPDTFGVIAYVEENGKIRVVAGKRITIHRPGSDMKVSIEDWEEYSVVLQDVCPHLDLENNSYAEQGGLYIDQSYVKSAAERWKLQVRLNEAIMDVAKREDVKVIFSDTFRKHSGARLVACANEKGRNWDVRSDVEMIYLDKKQLLVLSSPFSEDEVPLLPPEMMERRKRVKRRDNLDFSFIKKTNYEKVKELVEDGKLKIVTVMAPARVGSTFLGIALTESPSIDMECLVPFHWVEDWPFAGGLPRAIEREEAAYKKILDDYEQVKENSDTEQVTILAKCMIKNVGFTEQYERWDAITDKKIFLTRNPQLSIESLLRSDFPYMIDEGNKPFEKPDEYAQRYGFVDDSGNGEHWKIMEEHILETKDYSLLEEITKDSLPYSDVNNYLVYIQEDLLRNFNDKDAKKCGFRSLDNFASVQGYSNWDDMLEKTLDVEPKNLIPHKQLLEKVRLTSWTGWTAMEVVERKYLANSDDYLLVDSTIIRAQPEDSLKKIADFAEIEFTQDMVDNWVKASSQSYESSMTASFMRSFAGAYGNTEVKLPFEKPLASQKLPKHYREHIFNTAMVAYIKLMENSQMVRPKGKEEIEKLLNTAVTVDNTQLRNIDTIFSSSLDSESSDEESDSIQLDFDVALMKLINESDEESDSIQLTSETALLENTANDNLDKNKVTLRDTDPIFAFALISTDKLLSNLDKSVMLGQLSARYKDTFKQIFSKMSDIVTNLETERLSAARG